MARWAARGLLGALKATRFALEVYADLTPVVRMRGPRRLPKQFGAGLLGAEVATWWAISPSLLPRRWWVIAANVAICQAAGHAAGTGIGQLTHRARRRIARRLNPATLEKATAVAHTALATTTIVTVTRTVSRHEKEVALAARPEPFTLNGSTVGVVVGTLGYGALLLVGEGLQNWVDRWNSQLGRWMPPVFSWPLALTGVGLTLYLVTGRVVIRRWLSQVYAKAEALNKEVMPGATRPREPQRSGSPESAEHWDNLGRQGRSVVAAGPRAREITQVMGDTATEPIRIYIGLAEGRTPEEQIRLVKEEIERTGALERSALAIMTSAGTGWLNDFLTGPFEFLQRGDTALITMQYSFLPSAVSYVADRSTPVASSQLLINTLREMIDDLPGHARPKLYVAGESLGAYGLADSFESLEQLRATVDGAVFTGTPGFTQMHSDTTRRRAQGSPARLPVLDGGRHVRFVATSRHLEHDFAGQAYEHEWEFPRVLFAQHASDPIVWWDWTLFFRCPDWLREPGSRGVSAPPAQELDVFEGLRWVPFITGWQVGIDQVNCLDTLPGHGHVYRYDVIDYWAAVAGIPVTEHQKLLMSRWLRRDMERVRNEVVPIPAGIRQTIQSGLE